MKPRQKTAGVAIVLLAIGLVGTLASSPAGDLGHSSSFASTVMLPSALPMGVPMDRRIDENGPGEPGAQSSQHDVWISVFSALNDMRGKLMSQLDAAGEQYPELLLTFRLLATYSNFLEVRIRDLSRSQVRATGEELPPVMDLDRRFRTGLFPPDICPPYPDGSLTARFGLTMKDIRDITMEEKIEELNRRLSLLRSCDDIKTERQEKLDRLNELSAYDYLTSEQLEEMYECVERIKTLTDALLENGCITVLYLIVEPNLPVLQGT